MDSNWNALSRDSVSDKDSINTIEAIQSAIDQSLEEMRATEIKLLNNEEKKKLITFMEFVGDVEPDTAIQYLRKGNFDIQTAMDNFFREHPDHPQSGNESSSELI